MLKGFIEFEWNDGTLYRFPETDKYSDMAEWFREGEWHAPITPACPGYGYLEMAAQSDSHSGVFYREAEEDLEVIRIKAWWDTGERDRD